MVTPTPEELRQAADVVERWNETLGEYDPPSVSRSPQRLRAFATLQEAKNKRRERLVEELAQTMCDSTWITSSWSSTTRREEWSNIARAVIDRFPSLLDVVNE